MPSLLEAVQPRLRTKSKAATRDSARPARDRATARRYLSVLATAVLCYAALGTVLGILPGYVHSLGGGAVLVGFAVGAPALTGAACRPAGGRLADRLGPARIMITGALVMVVGTIPAFVQALPVLMLSRLVVGSGEAMMMAAAVLWLLRLAGPERRGRAMGHVGLANYAGLTVGPPLSQALSGDAHPTRVWIAAALLPLLRRGWPPSWPALRSLAARRRARTGKTLTLATGSRRGRRRSVRVSV